MQNRGKEKAQNTTQSQSKTPRDWGEMEPRKLTVSVDKG